MCIHGEKQQPNDISLFVVHLFVCEFVRLLIPILLQLKRYNQPIQQQIERKKTPLSLLHFDLPRQPLFIGSFVHSNSQTLESTIKRRTGYIMKMNPLDAPPHPRKGLFYTPNDKGTHWNVPIMRHEHN